MKTKKLIALLAIAAVMIFTSCKKDDSGPLSAEEAKAALNSADVTFNTIKGEVMASPGMMAEDAIRELGLPFNPPTKTKANFGTNPTEFTKGGIEPDYIYFNFTENTGTWEKVDGQWIKVLTTPTDKIVIKFSYNGGTNNGTLTYFDHVATPVPTPLKVASTYISQLKAKIDIEGQTNPVMSWVYTATQTLTGGSTKWVYTYGTAFSVVNDLSINRPSAGRTIIDYLFEVKKNGEIVFTKSFYTVIEGLLLKNIETYSINSTAKVIIMNIVIDYTITINQSTDTSNPGNFMVVTISLTDGTKVAVVVFVENEPYFEFADGTRVGVKQFLSTGLLEELEEFMDGLIGFYPLYI